MRLALKITEKEFQSMVLDLARLFGWTRAHFRPAMTRSGTWATAVQGDGTGFPDLILLRPPVMIVAELKVGKNRVTAEQTDWLAKFRACDVPAFVWTPEAWDEIEATLR